MSFTCNLLHLTAHLCFKTANPCKEIQDSLGLHGVDSGFLIFSFCQSNLGFRIP